MFSITRILTAAAFTLTVAIALTPPGILTGDQVLANGSHPGQSGPNGPGGGNGGGDGSGNGNPGRSGPGNS